MRNNKLKEHSIVIGSFMSRGLYYEHERRLKMAAFITRYESINCRIFLSSFSQYWRLMSTKQPANINEALPASQSLKSFELSMSHRGFLRAQKAYTPPVDAQSRLENIIRSLYSSPPKWDTKLEDPSLRYQLLSSCFNEFKHSIPNSMLRVIRTLGDVLEFYTTPVDTRTPLEAMKDMDLPPNLHVLHEYHRFHPDTDTMFGGISAFPKSSTIVTGLRYKKKYPGYTAKKSWP